MELKKLIGNKGYRSILYLAYLAVKIFTQKYLAVEVHREDVDYRRVFTR